MNLASAEIMVVMQPFAPVFSERIWDWVQVLVMGAILAPKQRTVTGILRVMGLGQERQFQNYHRVLNRAEWSSLRVSRILLNLLVTAFVPRDAPILLAADETLERRRGKKIAAKGHFRDAVLSSEKRHVASEGLRWVSMMLLVKVPWSQRVWTLPFLTVLAPHEKTNWAMGKRHRTSIDWVQQMTSQVRRWLPKRQIILVTDGGLIAVKLGLRCKRYRQPVTLISRLHLNIRLFDVPASSKRKNASSVGKRQPNLETRLCDAATLWTKQQMTWYGGKQRQVEWVTGTALWQTPSGLFSFIVLLAHHLTHSGDMPSRSTAWYTKPEVTFSDVLAFVRRHLWQEVKFSNSPQNTRLVQFPLSVLDDLLETLCYAS